MIIISGATFPYRDLLKSYHGRWNGITKSWEFDWLSNARIAELRGLVGIYVVNLVSADFDEPEWLLKPKPKLYVEKPVIVGDDQTYHNYFMDKNPIAFFGFSSLSAFVDHIEKLNRPINAGGKCDVGWSGKETYTATRDMAHAIEIARNGWTSGLDITDRLLPPMPMQKKRKRSVTGGSVNVGRMLSGYPDHMNKREKQPGRRIITIFVETCMWEGITINTALIRVILIAAMVDRLEQQGYSCNVVAVYSAKTRDRKHSYQTAVRIKEAGEKLSVADISFAFGHPSFGRRFCYAIEGSHSQCDLTTEARGRISRAFDNHFYPPARNEFYICQLHKNTNDIKEIIELIQPDGLPVNLMENET